MTDTFKDILSMVDNACSRVFYTGSKDAKETVIQCATQIYIQQMRMGLTEEGKTNETERNETRKF